MTDEGTQPDRANQPTPVEPIAYWRATGPREVAGFHFVLATLTGVLIGSIVTGILSAGCMISGLVILEDFQTPFWFDLTQVLIPGVIAYFTLRYAWQKRGEIKAIPGKPREVGSFFVMGLWITVGTITAGFAILLAIGVVMSFFAHVD